MVRRLLIALCLAVLATAGAVRPWSDGDAPLRRTSVDASGRALGATMSVRDKCAREAPATLWLPPAAVEAAPRRPGALLAEVTPTARAADAPRDARRPARAPPASHSLAVVEAGGRPAAATGSLPF
jgi:hypothetical protein